MTDKPMTYDLGKILQCSYLTQDMTLFYDFI
jgi:hypothetical protein